MASAQLFQPRTKTGKALLWFWDIIDISENLHRTDKYVRRVGNGLNAALHFVAMLVLFTVAFAFAWFFDFQSTIVGMSTLQELVVPSLPLQEVRITQIIVFALSISPTVMELFTAGLAKEDVKILQATIIGMSLFDLITDIPRTYAFAIQLWPQLNLMDWYMSYPAFWAFFFFWLFMATFGFEVLTVIFGFAALGFAWKWFDSDGSKSDRVAEMLNRASKGGAKIQVE